MAEGRVNTAQARAIVAALDRLPTTGEFAVSTEQRRSRRDPPGRAGRAPRRQGTADPGRTDLRGDRPRPRREVRRPGARGRRGPRAAADDVHDVRGRRRHLPRTLPHPRPARADAHQDDPRDQLTRRGPPTTTLASSSSGIDPDLPTPVRHGIALTQLIETYPAEKLPKTGGCSATVVVTMTLEQLIADLDHAGVCTLDTGGRITAAEARRLACTAGIIPVVLGGKSQPLDVGRRRRLHNETMRIAMGVRDRGCTAEGCETPPASATPTTTPPGPTAATPASTPADSSAPTTTAASTTPTTRPDTYPAEKSASTGGPRHTGKRDSRGHGEADVRPSQDTDWLAFRYTRGPLLTRCRRRALIARLAVQDAPSDRPARGRSGRSRGSQCPGESSPAQRLRSPWLNPRPDDSASSLLSLGVS